MYEELIIVCYCLQVVMRHKIAESSSTQCALASMMKDVENMQQEHVTVLATQCIPFQRQS